MRASGDTANRPAGRSVGWLLWLVGGVGVSFGYLLLPSGSLLANGIYDAIGLVSASTIVVAVTRSRPPRRHVWYWMAAGQATWVVGDLTYTLYENVLDLSPFPSVADVFYLFAYPLIAVGLALLIRSRRGGTDLAGLLDAAIVATGLGLLSWMFLIRPTLADDSTPVLTRTVSVAYPVADILLLAMIAMLLMTSGVRTASFRLLVVAVVAMLGSDVAFSVLTTFFDYNGGITDVGWLLSYVFWAAAALHPSVRRLAEPAPTTFSPARLAAISAAMLIAPGAVLVQGLTRALDIDWLGAGIGGVLVCLLALTRFVHLLNRTARLALRDDLTGLGNRRLLEDRLNNLPPGRTSLVLIDLTNFQQINDRLGRTTGDAVLVAVAQRLRAGARPGDLVARVGGDKFAVLLTTNDATGDAPDGMDRVIGGLRGRLGAPLSAGGHDLLVETRLGSARAGFDIPASELLRRADVAIHAAKQAGCGPWVHYHPGLDEQADEQARLGAALRTALDEGQFTLHYQPIVTLPDGRLAGVEALLRWRHPTAGQLGPATFIPVAEANGLIVEIGQWVLEQACRQAIAWDAEHGPAAPARMSVNVSARQLDEPTFAETVQRVLAATGLAPHRLTVEITETAVTASRHARQTLQALHALGVRIALDDFGTGHSSLALLKEYPVDVLKVDKSFVDDVARGGQGGVIAAAVIAMSRGLHLTAVAEGIESAAQADALHRLGYPYAQGYYFSRPVPPAEIQTAEIQTAEIRPTPPPVSELIARRALVPVSDAATPDAAGS